MSSGLDGCIQKINRAHVHLEALNVAIQAFLAEEPYPAQIKPKRYFAVEGLDLSNPDIPDAFRGPEAWIKDASLSLGVEKQPDFIAWGLLIGEVTHNLRCALDHLVWALSVEHSGPPPPGLLPRGNPWRNVSFPVVADATNWHSGLQKLSLVNPRLHARFKRLQPFARRKKTPDRDALVVLEQLWNIDKHRYVPIVVELAEFVRHTGRVPEGWPSQPPEITAIRRRRLGPLVADAELATLRVSGPILVNFEALQMYVSMNLEFRFDVAFEEGWPAYGGRVLATLLQIENRVKVVVAQFESALP